jgi:hypothetical protein
VPILGVCGYNCVGCDAAVLHCWDETLYPPASGRLFCCEFWEPRCWDSATRVQGCWAEGGGG